MKQVFIMTMVFFIAASSAMAQSKAGKKDTAKNVSYYTCSMHPEVKSLKPGKCPKCGMDLKLTGKEQMKAGVTKNYACPVHVDVVSHQPGQCPQCGRKMNLSAKEQMKAEVGKVYTCPMHPQVALDKDGKCPKCGGKLVVKKN